MTLFLVIRYIQRFIEGFELGRQPETSLSFIKVKLSRLEESVANFACFKGLPDASAKISPNLIQKW